MDMQKAFDEHDLIDMMFESTDIDTFKLLWGSSLKRQVVIAWAL